MIRILKSSVYIIFKISVLYKKKEYFLLYILFQYSYKQLLNQKHFFSFLFHQFHYYALNTSSNVAFGLHLTCSKKDRDIFAIWCTFTKWFMNMN